MYTNKENSTKLIRISPSVKKRLEIFQAGDTPNLCIDRMITFLKLPDIIRVMLPRIRQHWWRNGLRISSK